MGTEWKGPPSPNKNLSRGSCWKEESSNLCLFLKQDNIGQSITYLCSYTVISCHLPIIIYISCCSFIYVECIVLKLLILSKKWKMFALVFKERRQDAKTSCTTCILRKPSMTLYCDHGMKKRTLFSLLPLYTIAKIWNITVAWWINYRLRIVFHNIFMNAYEWSLRTRAENHKICSFL